MWHLSSWQSAMCHHMCYASQLHPLTPCHHICPAVCSVDPHCGPQGDGPGGSNHWERAAGSLPEEQATKFSKLLVRSGTTPIAAWGALKAYAVRGRVRTLACVCMMCCRRALCMLCCVGCSYVCREDRRGYDAVCAAAFTPPCLPSEKDPAQAYQAVTVLSCLLLAHRVTRAS